MRGKIQVETHKTSIRVDVNRFPPLIPERDRPGGSKLYDNELQSVHDLGAGSESLILENSGTSFAKKGVQLNLKITSLNEQIAKVTRGLKRARKKRSSFGGEAASKKAKQRETAKMNLLEQKLQMWTIRDNDCLQMNDLKREKINQGRIEMTALKRVFDKKCLELQESKDQIQQVMIEADAVEKVRLQTK
jgi:hypothetical protein